MTTVNIVMTVSSSRNIAYPANKDITTIASKKSTRENVIYNRTSGCLSSPRQDSHLSFVWGKEFGKLGSACLQHLGMCFELGNQFLECKNCFILSHGN